MQKFWRLKNSKQNQLIFIKDNCIYKGNPEQNDISRLTSETKDLSFLKNLYSIPYTNLIS